MVNWLNSKASGRNVILVFGLTVLSIAGMNMLMGPFAEATNGYRFIDMQIPVTKETILEQLPAYTDESRVLYFYFMVLDYIFPFLGGLFFALFWVWMFQRAGTALSLRLGKSPLVLFPFIATLLDWSENVGFFLTAWTYPNHSDALLNAGVLFREWKLPFMNGNFVLSAAVAVLALVLWWFGRRKETG